MNDIAYKRDFYGWLTYHTDLLQRGKWAEVDLTKIAEELESMGKRHQQELINRLAVLLMHLLKWQFQPGKRTHSWKYTIKEQRLRVRKILQSKT